MNTISISDQEKLCILLASSSEDIPFDLKHKRHVLYGDSISLLRKQLIDNLECAKSEVENIISIQIRVDFKVRVIL